MCNSKLYLKLFLKINKESSSAYNDDHGVYRTCRILATWVKLLLRSIFFTTFAVNTTVRFPFLYCKVNTHVLYSYLTLTVQLPYPYCPVTTSVLYIYQTRAVRYHIHICSTFNIPVLYSYHMHPSCTFNTLLYSYHTRPVQLQYNMRYWNWPLLGKLKNTQT